jgi:hypothetical protein
MTVPAAGAALTAYVVPNNNIGATARISARMILMDPPYGEAFG